MICTNFNFSLYFQFDQSDSDGEEPSPEALARYLAMRRHTVGVGDSKHETPEDVRAKLTNYQPMVLAMPQPTVFSPMGMLPHTNLPHLPLVMQAQHYLEPHIDSHLLKPPLAMAGATGKSGFLQGLKKS